MENQEYLLNNIGPTFVQFMEQQGKITVIDEAAKTVPYKPAPAPAPAETATPAATPTATPAATPAA
jgi:hypothetical protein